MHVTVLFGCREYYFGSNGGSQDMHHGSHIRHLTLEVFWFQTLFISPFVLFMLMLVVVMSLAGMAGRGVLRSEWIGWIVVVHLSLGSSASMAF